jgi:hypothetical protein
VHVHVGELISHSGLASECFLFFLFLIQTPLVSFTLFYSLAPGSSCILS